MQKKKTDTRPPKQSQDPIDGPLPEISQDLNSDLIHYTYKLEFELTHAKRKLKYQRKKFKRLIQSLSKYFDSKGVASRMVDEYIKTVSHQLGQESDSDIENNKNAHQNKHQSSEDSNHIANNNANSTTHATNNHKLSANSKSQKNPSNLIKINLTDVSTVTNTAPINGNIHVTPTTNGEVATVVNINPKDINKDDKKNPTFVINHEPKKRRSKKVKPNPETPESTRIKHEEKELPTAQIVKIDDLNKKYSTKKYEDLAEYAQKNSNEILKEFMYQNGMQDLLKLGGVDGNDIFKLNAMLQLNNPPFAPPSNMINEADLLNNYAKMIQDWMPANPNMMPNDKTSRDMLQFYHTFANK